MTREGKSVTLLGNYVSWGALAPDAKMPWRVGDVKLLV